MFDYFNPHDKSSSQSNYGIWMVMKLNINDILKIIMKKKQTFATMLSLMFVTKLGVVVAVLAHRYQDYPTHF